MGAGSAKSSSVASGRRIDHAQPELGTGQPEGRADTSTEPDSRRSRAPRDPDSSPGAGRPPVPRRLRRAGPGISRRRLVAGHRERHQDRLRGSGNGSGRRGGSGDGARSEETDFGRQRGVGRRSAGGGASAGPVGMQVGLGCGTGTAGGGSGRRAIRSPEGGSRVRRHAASPAAAPASQQPAPRRSPPATMRGDARRRARAQARQSRRLQPEVAQTPHRAQRIAFAGEASQASTSARSPAPREPGSRS